jgi:hypothetical protein
MFRSLLFVLSIPVCLVSGCTALVEAYDSLANAELRSRENTDAANVVRELGTDAEERYKRTFTVPTTTELNCDKEPCYFPTRFVSVDGNGVVHAEFHKLGVPFTPTSQFTATWNSAERTTNRDLLVSPWSWRLLSIPWLILGILLLVTPWSPRIIRAYFSHRKSVATEEQPSARPEA